MRRRQLVVSVPAINPCGHCFERNHTPRRNRGAGLGYHLSLTGKALRLLLCGFVARGREVGAGQGFEVGPTDKIGTSADDRQPIPFSALNRSG